MQNQIIAMWVCLALLALLVLWLFRKLSAVQDELTNMRYIRVKENPGGGYTLTSQDGKDIFEL